VIKGILRAAIGIGIERPSTSRLFHEFNSLAKHGVTYEFGGPYPLSVGLPFAVGLSSSCRTIQGPGRSEAVFPLTLSRRTSC